MMVERFLGTISFPVLCHPALDPSGTALKLSGQRICLSH